MHRPFSPLFLLVFTVSASYFVFADPITSPHSLKTPLPTSTASNTPCCYDVHQAVSFVLSDLLLSSLTDISISPSPSPSPSPSFYDTSNHSLSSPCSADILIEHYSNVLRSWWLRFLIFVRWTPTSKLMSPSPHALASAAVTRRLDSLIDDLTITRNLFARRSLSDRPKHLQNLVYHLHFRRPVSIPRVTKSDTETNHTFLLLKAIAKYLESDGFIESTVRNIHHNQNDDDDDGRKKMVAEKARDIADVLVSELLKDIQDKLSLSKKQRDQQQQRQNRQQYSFLSSLRDLIMSNRLLVHLSNFNQLVCTRLQNGCRTSFTKFYIQIDSLDDFNDSNSNNTTTTMNNNNSKQCSYHTVFHSCFIASLRALLFKNIQLIVSVYKDALRVLGRSLRLAGRATGSLAIHILQYVRQTRTHARSSRLLAFIHVQVINALTRVTAFFYRGNNTSSSGNASTEKEEQCTELNNTTSCPSSSTLDNGRLVRSSKMPQDSDETRRRRMIIHFNAAVHEAFVLYGDVISEIYHLTFVTMAFLFAAWFTGLVSRVILPCMRRFVELLMYCLVSFVTLSFRRPSQQTKWDNHSGNTTGDHNNNEDEQQCRVVSASEQRKKTRSCKSSKDASRVRSSHSRRTVTISEPPRYVRRESIVESSRSDSEEEDNGDDNGMENRYNGEEETSLSMAMGDNEGEDEENDSEENDSEDSSVVFVSSTLGRARRRRPDIDYALSKLDINRRGQSIKQGQQKTLNQARKKINMSHRAAVDNDVNVVVGVREHSGRGGSERDHDRVTRRRPRRVAEGGRSIATS